MQKSTGKFSENARNGRVFLMEYACNPLYFNDLLFIDFCHNGSYVTLKLGGVVCGLWKY